MNNPITHIYSEALYSEALGWGHILSSEPINSEIRDRLWYALKIVMAQYTVEQDFLIYIGKRELTTGEKLVAETEKGIYIVPKQSIPLLQKEEVFIVNQRIFLEILKLETPHSDNPVDTDAIMNGLMNHFTHYCIITDELKIPT